MNPVSSYAFILINCHFGELGTAILYYCAIQFYRVYHFPADRIHTILAGK